MTGYVIIHEGKTFSPEGKTAMSPTQAAEHNATLERHELAEWQRKPLNFPAYVSTGENVTTWWGTNIGRIVAFRRYRNNFGARIECITVRGTNGATYHGRYGCDWSQLVRLRRSKA